MKIKLTIYKNGKEYPFSVSTKSDEAASVLIDALFDAKCEAYIERSKKKILKK